MDARDARFLPIETALTAATAAVVAGQSALAIPSLALATAALAGLKALWTEPADPFARLSIAGLGCDAGFVFRHAAPHPFDGYMGRYPKEDGDVRKLLGYATTYALWFCSRAPLMQYVLWGDGRLHPAALFADNGRLCCAELAGPISRGEIPVVAVPLDPDQLRYPDTAVGPDLRNKGPFALNQLAQGPTGPAKAFYDALVTIIRRLVAAGVSKALFRPGWEHTGNWFRNSATAGQGGYWLLTINHIADVIKANMPGGQIVWNMAHTVSAGMAPVNDTLWLSATDAATINADGSGMVVTAGTPIKADVLGIDAYNSCWASTSQVTNAMSADVVQAVLAKRWTTEPGRYFDMVEAAAAKLGAKLCIPEWGTGYDGKGVPLDSAGKPLFYDGKAGGDDPYYIEQIYTRALKWRRAGQLVFLCYWERKAWDGHTVLSFAACVAPRTGKLHSWAAGGPDPFLKEKAARRFVECFGVPSGA